LTKLKGKTKVQANPWVVSLEMSYFDFLERKTKGQAHPWVISLGMLHFDFFE